MAKHLRNTLVTTGILAAGTFTVFKWLFKEPNHASTWSVSQALEYYAGNGEHHPKLSAFTKNLIKVAGHDQD